MSLGTVEQGFRFTVSYNRLSEVSRGRRGDLMTLRELVSPVQTRPPATIGGPSTRGSVSPCCGSDGRNRDVRVFGDQSHVTSS